MLLKGVKLIWVAMQLLTEGVVLSNVLLPGERLKDRNKPLPRTLELVPNHLSSGASNLRFGIYVRSVEPWMAFGRHRLGPLLVNLCL